MRGIKQAGSWEAGIPEKNNQKKAIATASSLPQPMRNFLLLDSGNHLIALSDGRKEK